MDDIFEWKNWKIEIKPHEENYAQLIEKLQLARNQLTPIIDYIIDSALKFCENGDEDDKFKLTPKQCQSIMWVSKILKETEQKYKNEYKKCNVFLPNSDVIVNNVRVDSKSANNGDNDVVIDETTVLELLRLYEEMGEVLRKMVDEGRRLNDLDTGYPKSEPSLQDRLATSNSENQIIESFHKPSSHHNLQKSPSEDLRKKSSRKINLSAEEKHSTSVFIKIQFKDPEDTENELVGRKSRPLIPDRTCKKCSTSQYDIRLGNEPVNVKINQSNIEGGAVYRVNSGSDDNNINIVVKQCPDCLSTVVGSSSKIEDVLEEPQRPAFLYGRSKSSNILEDRREDSNSYRMNKSQISTQARSKTHNKMSLTLNPEHVEKSTITVDTVPKSNIMREDSKSDLISMNSKNTFQRSKHFEPSRISYRDTPKEEYYNDPSKTSYKDILNEEISSKYSKNSINKSLQFGSSRVSHRDSSNEEAYSTDSPHQSRHSELSRRSFRDITKEENYHTHLKNSIHQNSRHAPSRVSYKNEEIYPGYPKNSKSRSQKLTSSRMSYRDSPNEVTYPVYSNNSIHQSRGYIPNKADYRHSNQASNRFHDKSKKNKSVIPLNREKICSSMEFDVSTVQTKLREEGIEHLNPHIVVELKRLGVNQVLRACRPAKCCRKAILDEKQKVALPYCVSLRSLPLTENDVSVIEQSIDMSVRKIKNSLDLTQDYRKKMSYYLSLGADEFTPTINFPWVVSVYGMTISNTDKSQITHISETQNRKNKTLGVKNHKDEIPKNHKDNVLIKKSRKDKLLKMQICEDKTSRVQSFKDNSSKLQKFKDKKTMTRHKNKTETTCIYEQKISMKTPKIQNLKNQITVVVNHKNKTETKMKMSKLEERIKFDKSSKNKFFILKRVSLEQLNRVQKKRKGSKTYILVSNIHSTKPASSSLELKSHSIRRRTRCKRKSRGIIVELSEESILIIADKTINYFINSLKCNSMSKDRNNEINKKITDLNMENIGFHLKKSNKLDFLCNSNKPASNHSLDFVDFFEFTLSKAGDGKKVMEGGDHSVPSSDKMLEVYLDKLKSEKLNKRICVLKQLSETHLNGIENPPSSTLSTSTFCDRLSEEFLYTLGTATFVLKRRMWLGKMRKAICPPKIEIIKGKEIVPVNNFSRNEDKSKDRSQLLYFTNLAKGEFGFNTPIPLPPPQNVTTCYNYNSDTKLKPEKNKSNKSSQADFYKEGSTQALSNKVDTSDASTQRGTEEKVKAPPPSTQISTELQNPSENLTDLHAVSVKLSKYQSSLSRKRSDESTSKSQQLSKQSTLAELIEYLDKQSNKNIIQTPPVHSPSQSTISEIIIEGPSGTSQKEKPLTEKHSSTSEVHLEPETNDDWWTPLLVSVTSLPKMVEPVKEQEIIKTNVSQTKIGESPEKKLPCTSNPVCISNKCEKCTSQMCAKKVSKSAKEKSVPCTEKQVCTQYRCKQCKWVTCSEKEDRKTKDKDEATCSETEDRKSKDKDNKKCNTGTVRIDITKLKNQDIHVEAVANCNKEICEIYKNKHLMSQGSKKKVKENPEDRKCSMIAKDNVEIFVNNQKICVANKKCTKSKEEDEIL